jgi:putative membrane protein
VWTISYVGLLPLSGLFEPATEQPARRNALMIAAHVVWGLGLGVLTEVARRRMR